MPVALDDVRHFESAVELSPEDQQGNLDYFREQGLQADLEGEVAPGGEPAKTEPETPAKAVERPEPESVETDPDPDAPDPADATPGIDGDKQKLGWRAKKTQQIRDLEATLAAEKGANEELRRQLEAKAKAPAIDTPALSLSPAPAAEPAKAAEPPKAKEFDKPRPVLPKFEDFASADDPIAAHADAVAEYTDKVSDWKDEKREFDNGQKQAIQTETQQQERLRQAQIEQTREVAERVEAIKVTHPDFEAVTNNKFNPVLSYVLREAVPDGLEIGYQLGKPENADLLAELRKSSTHKETDSQREIERKIAHATYEVAQIAQTLKQRATTPPPKTPKAAEPTDETEQTPPKAAKAAEPRREDATPSPVRSRGAAAKRLEDIPKENYDERRAWRAANGEL